jgi:hypothetical protein
MSTNLVRQRFAALAVKIESTPGTDAIAGTPANADYLEVNGEIQFDQTAVPNPVMTGSLDPAASIVGGMRARLRLTVPLRGSGTAGTAPEWGRLMQCATMQETLTAAAVPASPLALSAGGASAVTLGATFGTTAQQYRGMPLALGAITGDQPALSAIADYTAGRVASLIHTVSTTFTVTQTAQIPINQRYSPTSDEAVFKTCTIYAYQDGMRWRFTGCLGTWSLELTTGGIGFLSFDFMGSFVPTAENVSMPVGWNTAARPTAPRFVAGACRLAGAVARVGRFSVQAGVNTVLPENPEAAEGYDPAVPVSRNVVGSIDPLMDTTVSIPRFNNFRNGINMSLGAILGSTPGNRFAIVLPSVRATAMNPGQRGGLVVDTISFEAEGPDATVFLTAF